MNDKWKVFFAVPFSDENRKALQKNLIESEIQLPEREIESSNWHITIFFVGMMDCSKVAPLIQTLSGRSWPRKFEISLNHLGAFPDINRAQVLWWGVGTGKDELHELAQILTNFLQDLGFTTDPKSFQGHLTLSRLRQPKDLRKLLNTPLKPVSVSVNRFVLFRSRSEAGFQRYEELASFRLI